MLFSFYFKICRSDKDTKLNLYLKTRMANTSKLSRVLAIINLFVEPIRTRGLPRFEPVLSSKLPWRIERLDHPSEPILDISSHRQPAF